MYTLISYRKTLAVASLFLLFISKPLYAQPTKPVIIGYVGGYNGLADTVAISPEKLTHINYAFVDVQEHRALLTNERTDTVNFRKLNELKKRNPALKILISLGGWSWSRNFSDAVLTDTSRRAFAHSAVDILRKHHLDGVDIDWEYPGRPGADGNIYRPEDKENFTLMFKELRAALDILENETQQKKLLTTAVGGFVSFLDHTEMGEAQRYLDYVNLMTYDFGSRDGEAAKHHTNLLASKEYPNGHSAHETINAFVAAGVPIEKLVMGIAFYGRNLQLQAGAKRGLGDLLETGTFGKGYTLIKDSLLTDKNYRAYRDKSAKAPYIYNAQEGLFITYDDEWSVKEKCKYVLKNGMGGVMFWQYSSDPKEYLLDEINSVFKSH